MKKEIKMIITIIICVIILNIISSFLSKGHQVKYKVDKFTIYETRIRKTKDEYDTYHFKITKKDLVFDFQTNINLKQKYVLSKIKYYEDDKYICILPITKNDKQFSDFMCYSDGKYYAYNYIEGKDEKLDKYVKKYHTENKNKVLYEDDYIKLYDNLNNSLFSIETYKGLYNVSNNLKEIKLFKRDIYNKPISTYINDKYLVADYNQKYDFHIFYLIDIKTNKKEKIVSDKAISFYSYVQGVVDNEVYIIDTANKMQYAVNIDEKTVLVAGDEESGIKVYDGKWAVESIYKALNDKLYFNSNTKNEKYARIDKIGGNKTGFYYYYLLDNNKYKVYRKSIQNPKTEVLLFECSDIENIIYDFDYVVYKDGNYIKYYSDLTGVRKIAKYNEIAFNKSIKFNYKR